MKRNINAGIRKLREHLRFGKTGSQLFQNPELNVGLRYSGRNPLKRGNGLPHSVEKALQTIKHGDGRKCRAAEVVNQPQGLQAVKPDMELTPEVFGIRAVPADDRPIDCEPGKIEIRLKAGMDFSGGGQDGLRSPVRIGLHPGKPFPEDRENSGIMEAVFIRPPFMNRSIRCPVPKGTLSEGREEGKTVVVPIWPIFRSLASLSRK